ncbi:prsB7 (nucleomorph) [Hemiselmis andersenii]|uniref:Proteasome subunit beta n=1 Tax=Hemiselmis andersenii TaxID=464988 RepID=A9BL56_HEMAN|nr:prsB7 [Hemiselmis andersenii]ABW98239.1 prsB7 [Hemiselmis andersenii]|mmetsp:Transcript_25392/g.58844  ORF Transcript_25392/g.58844 Transcript_25392/m.58844 type:complete len:246 (+) Transcript_25392:156-893(+)
MSLLHYDDDYKIWKDFNLKNFWRNEKEFLINPASFFSIKKTGTTICGMVFKHGILLASDTRATNGEIICDTNCEKIHFIAPNICCCGAGTSADTENITKLLSNQLELQRISSGRETNIQTAISICQKILFQHKGFLSAALIFGGFDFFGSNLFCIHPHGSSEKIPYISMGSGSLAAMAVLDNNYKNNLSLKEAVLIIQESIKAGIYNDTGSGGSLDLCILTKKKIRFLRNKIFSGNPEFRQNFTF